MKTLQLDLDTLDPKTVPADREPLRLIVRAPTWQLDELHGDPDAVRRRLRELADFRDRAANVLSLSSFKAVPTAPDRHDGGKAADIVGAWERYGRRFNGDFAATIDKAGLLGRTIVLRQGADEALYYAFIGDGYTQRLGRRWVRGFLGQRHDATGQHDEAYSAWCAHHYASAVGGDEPRRHFVDAVIAPVTPGLPSARVNYDRLLLPVSLADGRPALVVVGEVRPGLLPIQ